MPQAQDTGRSCITLPPDLARHRLIDSAQTAALYGYSLPHFRRLYREGKVPKPTKINGRKVGWPVGIVLDDIAAKSATAMEAA